MLVYMRELLLAIHYTEDICERAFLCHDRAREPTILGGTIF